ncbi:hypothetical protein COP2_030740 [Malus domestica]
MQPLHSTELRTRRGKLRNRRGIYVSKRVSICHMHTQLCGNHGQFVEAPIPDIEEALAFQTCQRLSHAHSALRKSRAVCRSVDSRYRKGICFSRRVSACHMHTQPYGNYG